MDALKRAFLKFDRRFGGTEPPPRAQVFLARHPVGTGVVLGVVNGMLLAWVLSAFDDPGRMLQAVLWGLGVGLFFWLLCRVERWRQAHYERTDGFRPTPAAPPVPEQDRPPVWFEGVHWLCLWGALTVLLWLAGRLKDPPNDWPTSAILAGVAVIGSWGARLLKERRRRRPPGGRS
ncbi:hypothetical protein [Streptomyces sp. S.PNR 29]|uniref:hypothetical protein n=1 Tax=Streptomyces sp. S.PNR 29 TaxID=2973805 RepID=UPI0025AF0D44|nr:hypothetical protein [Streptomyces sp. S.PNR 29]MDN0200985.1 hypothetical protein [Streptomyces sp. S.PNR 29]